MNTDTHVGVRTSMSDTETPGTVSERLRLAIRAAGGNKAVSQKSGVPVTTIDGALSAGSMRLHTALQLADATGVTVEWLATGRGPMRPGDPPAGPPPAAEKPQETAPSGPLYLFPNAKMDRLAAAYAAARGVLAQRGIHTPDPLDLVRIMCLIYDELTDAEEKPDAP